MNYDDTYIGTVFLAPASYLIEELQEQEKEVFKNRVFQYDNLVCGIVDKIDSKRGYVWVTFKVPDNNYADCRYLRGQERSNRMSYLEG